MGSAPAILPAHSAPAHRSHSVGSDSTTMDQRFCCPASVWACSSTPVIEARPLAIPAVSAGRLGSILSISQNPPRKLGAQVLTIGNSAPRRLDPPAGVAVLDAVLQSAVSKYFVLLDCAVEAWPHARFPRVDDSGAAIAPCLFEQE